MEVLHSRPRFRSVYRFFRIVVLAVAFTALLCLLLAGCSAPALKVSTANLLIDVGLNTSASSRDHLPDSLSFSARVAASFNSSSTWLSVWRIDSSTHEIYSGPTFDSSESMIDTLAGDLEDLPADSTSHTVVFWETLSARCKASAAPHAIIVAGDGYTEGDDSDCHARIQVVARELAELPTIVVAFVGVKAGTRELIEQDFGALGDRLRFFESSQAEEFVALVSNGGGVR